MNETPEEILEARNEFSAFEDSNDFWECLIAYSSSQEMLQEYIEDSEAIETWKNRARNLQKSYSRVFVRKLNDFGEITLDEQIEALAVQIGISDAFINAVREDSQLQSIIDCFLSRVKKGLTWQRYIKSLDELTQKRRAEAMQ